jgi:hypothetical protein
MAIEIVSLRHSKPSQSSDVRVDRQTKWGNPYPMSGRSSQERDRVIEEYSNWIVRRPELIEELKKLEPKRLFCWCAPQRCHAEVLVALIEGK